MADNDISSRQRAVIEFLLKEEILAAEIHQRIVFEYYNKSYITYLNAEVVFYWTDTVQSRTST
jgi:hypothetical protein